MGISGLLPFLKSIHRPCHIKSFEGQTLGVDAYVWLHRGVYSCANELALGKPTTRYVSYAMAKVRMLRHHGVEPYLVFDGGPLPSKKGTEESRRKGREEARDRGRRLVAEGKEEEARECLAKSVDVTPEMAYQLIKALRLEKVRYVVAPFEADAQLRFLEMHGHIDGIVTEDSDLLVFGARSVVFKLDKDGACVHIRRDDFAKVPDSGMAFWTDRQFRQMAILSGCDYLASIPGIGLRKANELIRRCKTVEKAINNIALNHKNFSIPRGYLKSFRTAELTFVHQLVYDPTACRLVHLHPLADPAPSPEDLAGCGSLFPDETAAGVAEGSLHPSAHEPIKDAHFTATSAPMTLGARNKANEHASWYRSTSQKKPAQLSKDQTTLGSFFQPRPKTPPTTQMTSRNAPSSPSPKAKASSKFFSKPPPALVSKSTLSLSPPPQAADLFSASDTVIEVDDDIGDFEELPIEDAEPLDQAEWFEASQEEEDREAVARQEDDWKSEVLSIAAAEDDGLYGPVAEVDRLMREDWEGGMDGWDADLPSSQMHGAVADDLFDLSSSLVSEEGGPSSFVDVDVGEEQDQGLGRGLAQEEEPDDSADRTGSGATSFFEDFSDPVTSPVTSPEHVSSAKRPLSDHDLKVTVLAPASSSNPADPFTGGSDVIRSSDDDEILQPRVPSLSSIVDHRKQGFIPSPSHRRVQKKPPRANKDASSSEGSEEKDAALAKFKQDLRARFSHRGGGSAIVGPVGADPKSALARGKRLTLARPQALASTARKRTGPADLADVLDPPSPPSRTKRRMERREQEEEEGDEEEEVEPRARPPLSKKRGDVFDQRGSTVTHPRLQTFMFGR